MALSEMYDDMNSICTTMGSNIENDISIVNVGFLDKSFANSLTPKTGIFLNNMSIVHVEFLHKLITNSLTKLVEQQILQIGSKLATGNRKFDRM